MRTTLSRIPHQIEACLNDAQRYLRENSGLVISLGLILLVGYGYELFSLNLTIDEEVHALFPQYTEWIAQGRWGMFLLNKFLLPQPVIPFIPLAIALVFHLAAILVVMRCWGITSTLESLIVGAIGVSFSGMAVIYAFSTLNYGIGIGLFLISISLWIYSKSTGRNRLYAGFPAAAAFSIYQNFVLVFACAFLIYFIITEIQAERVKLNIQDLAMIVGVGLLAILLYWVLHQIFMQLVHTSDNYIAQVVDIDYLRTYPRAVLSGLRKALTRVYLGADSVYGQRIRLFGVLLGTGALGVAASILRSRLSVLGKGVLACLALMLMLIPFALVLVTWGFLYIRSLIAVPISVSGWLALSMLKTPRSYKLVVGILAAACTFQFTVSSNLLFSSSRLSLEADRVLAAEIINRIDVVKSDTGAGEELEYLEVIGYLDRRETHITPKIEILGASFFEWDEGNPSRITFFLNLLGYQNIQPLPNARRGDMIQIGTTMPAWPDTGSVVAVDDTILLKLGPYSKSQVRFICRSGDHPVFCDSGGKQAE